MVVSMRRKNQRQRRVEKLSQWENIPKFFENHQMSPKCFNLNTFQSRLYRSSKWISSNHCKNQQMANNNDNKTIITAADTSQPN